MHLARHSITSTQPIQIADARFDASNRIFTCATPNGFAIYQAFPLRLLRKHDLTDSTLAMVLPLHSSSLLFLLGGGTTPLYPPNKVILWDEAQDKAVAELEFREKVRGMACRRGWLAVALRRRVVVFEISNTIYRHAEYETNENLKGLVALATATSSTLLAIPGRQMGHVQLVHLPPCPPPRLSTPTVGSVPLPLTLPTTTGKHPVSIIIAHETALSTITVTTSGRMLATTSARGTLVRVWDAITGNPIDSFRRGADQAEIYSVAFRPDEKELCVCSDKGTVHVFVLPDSISGSKNRVSMFSQLSPILKLPKYFESKWSYARFRLPAPSSHIALTNALSSNAPLSVTAELAEDDRSVVGWIDVPVQLSGGSLGSEYQLVALTHSGGWYRLALPAPSPVHIPASPPSSPSRKATPSVHSIPAQVLGSGSSNIIPSPVTDKNKNREGELEKEHAGRDCALVEFRRYGQWDGWA